MTHRTGGGAGRIGGMVEPFGAWRAAQGRGYADPGDLDDALRAAWDAATLAERERCAKAALGDEDRDDFPWCGDVREIAAAIRTGV
jgi:hypothetical protein